MAANAFEADIPQICRISRKKTPPKRGPGKSPGVAGVHHEMNSRQPSFVCRPLQADSIVDSVILAATPTM